jgi:mono/diheme cytochrome c family protein
MKDWIRLTALAVAVALSAALSRGALAEAGDAARGEYLAHAAGCMTCHTMKNGEGPPFAGGRAIASPYGHFYSSNITPDRETGIGGWSDADFIHALRHGESPEGRTYYPVFPYAAFSAMRRQDMLDIKAYLFSLPPIRQENSDHDIRFPFSWRFSIYPWRWLFFSPGEAAAPPPSESAQARGRYLVEVLGHCGECHTPRNMVGGLKSGRRLAGTRYGPGGLVPNITPDDDTGIGGWSEGDLLFFFKTGLKPDGNDVQGEMREVIEDGLSRLNEADLRAVAAYLKSVPAIRHAVRPARKSAAEPDYGEW